MSEVRVGPALPTSSKKLGLLYALYSRWMGERRDPLRPKELEFCGAGPAAFWLTPLDLTKVLMKIFPKPNWKFSTESGGMVNGDLR